MNSKSLIVACSFILAIVFTGCFSTQKAADSSVMSNQGTAGAGFGGGQGGAGGTTETNNNNPDAPAVQESRYGETPEDSIQCVRNLSLYSEHYRQDNYDRAYKSWQEAIDICPKASQNLYIHGSRLLKDRINKVEPERKDEIVDSLMWLHDKRIKHFGREGYVLGRKGVDLYLFSSNRATEIYEMTEKSIELEGKESQPDVVLINLQSAVTLAQASLKEEIEIYRKYERAFDIIEYNIENNPQRARAYERITSQIESLCRPYTTCDVLVQVYTPRLEESPEDVQLLEEVTSTLDEADCHDEELFYETTRDLHRIQPTASSAFLMGRLETDLENYNKAVEYYAEAAELFGEKDNKEEQYRAYMVKAEMLYRRLSRYSQARNSALKAAEINPDCGRPYILIGDMYANTAEECGDDDFTQRVAYWAAVDKFRKAKDTDSDPDIVERADELISAYSRFFPDRETIFFHGYEEGDSYRVECWINETTTVRAR